MNPSTSAPCVYLDSSDFSVLSDSNLADAGLRRVKEQLIQWADSRTVRFCFSDVHAYEVAPTMSAYTHHAKQRIQLLSRLCADNGLLASDRILKREARALGSGSHCPWDAEPILGVPGGWIPDMTDSLKTQCKVMRTSYLRRRLELPESNRDARRNLSKYLDDREELTNRGRIYMHAQAKDIAVQIASLPAMPAKDRRTMELFYVGKATLIDAAHALANGVSNIGIWGERFDKDYEKFAPLVDGFRALGLDRISRLERIKMHIEKMLLEPLEGSSQHTRRSASDKVMDQLKKGLIEALVTRMAALEEKQWTAPEMAIASKVAPSLVCYVESSVELSRMSFFGDMPRTPKASDSADIDHAVFLPHMDVFRCDRTVSAVLSPLGEKFNTHVVSRLADLPSVIEAAIT